MAKLAKFFPAYLVLYFLLIVFNASLIPVAWVDEVMMIDPGFQLLKSGEFFSKIWPFEGTEGFFAAYLPLTSLLYTIALSIGSNSIFTTRIAWIILFALHIWFLYRLLLHQNIKKEFIYLIIFIYINLEGITNSMRSGRAEIPELLFLSAFLFFYLVKKNAILSGLFLILLCLTHPSMWMIGLISGIWIMFGKSEIKFKLYFSFSLIIPVLIFLLFVGKNILNYQDQLFIHAAEHTSSQNQDNFLIAYFYDFYLPIYAIQPYSIVFIWLIFAFSIYQIVKFRNTVPSFISVLFIGTYIFWMLTLAAFFRYTSVLVFLSVLLIPDFINYLKSKIKDYNYQFVINKTVKSIAIVFLLIIISFPFFARNIVSILQYDQRSTKKLYDWLDATIQSKEDKILIIGAPVGLFYSMRNNKINYTLTYGTRKYNFKDYAKVYYLKHREDRINGKLISTYPLKESEEINYLSNFFKTETYLGMSLYQISSEKEMQSLNHYFD